jgi:methionyl-tRNA synthetase
MNKMEEERVYNFYYPENDGYGIVGYSFECLYCEKENRFVNEDKEEHTCEHCGKVNYFER